MANDQKSTQKPDSAVQSEAATDSVVTPVTDAPSTDAAKTEDKVAEKTQVTETATTDAVVTQPKVTVELDPDFEGGVSSATVSVANYEDLVLEAGKTYDVPAEQAELLLSSPAVKVAE